MIKYQYELHIDIYLMSRLLFCAPFSGDGCDESHDGSSCHVCGDHHSEPEPGLAAFVELAVEPAAAFAGETEQGR
jgi:hypothetical protein